MINSIRCFIAMELTPAIQAKLTGILKILKQNIPDGVKWIPVENIHLTIKFLGDVELVDLDPIKNGLDLVVNGIHPVRVSLTELGAFPGTNKPRVIWIGLDAPSIIESMVKNIDRETRILGYAEESRPFSPHLTLGRTSRSIRSSQLMTLSNFLKSNPIKVSMQDTLHTVTLFRSSLTPAGAIYSRIYSIELAD